MYRLLIVDDEPLVQIGLKSLLAQGYQGQIALSGTASNGKQALEIIEKEHPEIVIADVRMPVMDGLELLRICHERYGSVPAFIMLTAYEEFDMARQALVNGAVDYLVKIELNKENLQAALRRAMQRADEHSSASAGPSGSHTASMENLQQNFLIRLLNGNIPDEAAIKEESAALHLPLAESDRYLCVCCRMETQLSADSPQLLTLYNSSLGMTKDIILRYRPAYFISDSLQYFSILFCFQASESVADLIRQVRSALHNAHEMIHNYFNVSILSGLGTVVTTSFEIPVSFKEGSLACEQADDDHQCLLFSHIVGSNRRSGKDKMIASIKEYIDNNLSEKLQLSQVADTFGISSAYLSAIFKKSTGTGFSEYVSTRKIQKAKKMLLQGDIKIYEAADALGFESAYYFSKVFKKIDGHSPTEYIRSKSDNIEDNEQIAD